jgi:hypothetical protein
MITSTLGRMADADKLSVQQLKQAVQDGTVPAYIGIPLIQEKMKQSQQMQASQQAQAPKQPPIADQILQQASGIPELPSNLPAQYAHGGIIHMADGGQPDQEEFFQNLPPASSQDTTPTDKYKLALWAEKNNPDMLTANNNELAALLMRSRIGGTTYSDRSEEEPTPGQRRSVSPFSFPEEFQAQPGDNTFGERIAMPRPEHFKSPNLEKGVDHRERIQRLTDSIHERERRLGMPYSGEYYAQGGAVRMAVGGDPMAMARAFTSDEEDPEDIDFLNALGANQMPETQEPDEEPLIEEMRPESGGISDLTPVNALAYASPYSTSNESDQITVKNPGSPAQTVRKETSRVERPANDYEKIAFAVGEKYKLDPTLIKHVMFKETGGVKDKAGAVSSAGAMGVMQLMPATAKELGVKDPFDPVQNIEGGVKYLAKMQNKYGDPRLAAIAYNWGPGRTDRWLAQGGDFSKLPKETQGYVKGLAGGGMTDDEDTDGLTVDLNNPDQTTGFDINQLTDVAGEGNVSETKTPPPKRESTVNKILESAGISGLTNKARELYYKSRLGEKREQAAEEMVPGLFEKLTPEERASRVKNTKQLLENPKKAKVLTKEELADLFGKGYPDLPKQTNQSLLNDADRNLRAQPAKSSGELDNASAKESAKDAQISLRALEKDEEIKRALAEQPQAEKKEVAAKPADRAGYDELKEYFTKGIAGLEDQKKINAYMALLAGGLGVMGGTSPHAAVNIGQGAQAGIGAYLTGSKDIAAQNAAMMQGRLGLEKYQSLRDIQAETIKSREAYHEEAEKRRRELAAQTDARIREIAQGNLEQKQHLLEERQFTRKQAEQQQASRQIEAMESHARVNARLTAQTLINKNPNLQFDAAQAQQLQSDLESKAMAGLYNNPAYLAQHKILNPAFNPGQITIPDDISSLVDKYKPKK